MKAIIQRLKKRFRPGAPSPDAGVIAHICGAALKDVGLNVPGSIFQLNNSNNQAGWLINLALPPGFSLPPVEVLTLRLFLVKRICKELKLAPQNVRLIVSFNVESKRLPFPQNMVNEDWLRARIALFMVRAATPVPVKAASPARQAPSEVPESGDLSARAHTSPTPLTARVDNPLQPPITSTLIYRPDAQASSKPQQKTSRQIMDELTKESEDIKASEFAVFDGSLSDFQRAFK